MDNWLICQKGIGRLEKWTDLTKFCKRKCKVWHVGREPHASVQARAKCLENNFAEEDLSVLMDKMNVSQQCGQRSKWGALIRMSPADPGR